MLGKETCPYTDSKFPLLLETSLSLKKEKERREERKQQYLQMCFSISFLVILSMLCWRYFLTQVHRGEKHMDINLSPAILSHLIPSKNREALSTPLEEKL